jgi:uroporphyrinogen decarboxylase
MTSRERVHAALDHKEPDRVPLDLGATPSSGISVIAYNRLKTHLGIEGGHSRVYDVVQQLAQPEDAILDRLGVDVVDIGRTFNSRDADWHDVTLADGSSAEYPSWFTPEREPDGGFSVKDREGTRIASMPSGATFFDQTCFPYVDGYPPDFRGLDAAMRKVPWSALAHSPWDSSGETGFWTRLRENALSLRAASDRALMIVCGCNLFEWGSFLRRLDNFLMDIYSEPATVEGLLDALMEVHLATLGKVCDAVGDVADVIRFGDDLGYDAGPFMSPDVYRAIFKPRHSALCSFVKAHSAMRTFLHSCGGIAPLIPDLIEAGFEALNPVQTSANGMDPAILKKQFGKEITFWGGGADTRRVLNFASPADVRRHVRERLSILSAGGGFVFAAVHNVMPDVPPENAAAMFDAVSEFNGGCR